MPQLYPLLAAVLSPKRRASAALVMAAMEAGAQWLDLLHTRPAYAEHSCPVALEEAAGLEGALSSRPGAALETQGAEQELAALATLMTSSASAALKAAQSESWDSEGSQAACMVLEAALSSAHLLQSWAAEDELRTFLQASHAPCFSHIACPCLRVVSKMPCLPTCTLQLCLKQASMAGVSAAGARAQQACVHTLCNPEFAEWRRLGAVLPAAAALELQLGPGGEVAPTPTPSKRSTRANKASDAEAWPGPQQPVLDSQGLRKGCAALAVLAASLPEAALAAGASTRKRKAPAAVAGAAADAPGLLRVLGRMPLGHLPEAEAARLAAVAGSGMVSSVTAGLQALLAADQVGVTD